MDFNIRLAVPSDTVPLAELFNSDTRIFGEGRNWIGEQDILEYIADPKKKVLVCILSDKIIGAPYG